MAEFLPVRVKTLRPGAPLNFDVYIQLGERKVHYIRESDPMEGERLAKLKEKGVRKLYIEESSEDRYLEYLDAGLDSLNDSSKDMKDRAGIANDSMVTAAENAERSIETEHGFRRTEAHFAKITEFLTSDRGAIKSILEAAGCALDNHQHAATVSSLAVALATKAGIAESKEILQLGIAGLVHDIGKNKLGIHTLKPDLR